MLFLGEKREPFPTAEMSFTGNFCPEWFFGNISKIELDTLSNKRTA
jgi:hypothetical protein